MPNENERSWSKTVITALIIAIGAIIAAYIGIIPLMGPKLATVQGVITDNDGNPVKDAVVEINGLSVTTGTDGRYVIRDVSMDTKTITVRAPGTKVDNVLSIPKGAELITRDITLSPLTPTPTLTTTITPTQTITQTPSPAPSPTPTPNKVYLVPQHSNASFCNTVEAQIWATTTDTFGSGQINLTYSHCCANVTNLEYDSLWQRTWDSSIDGREWLVFTRELGQPTVNGTVMIGNFTIHCCNESECVTSLTFSSPSKLSNLIAGDLTVTWIDGTFECIRQVCGDVNCDDIVDSSDLSKLQFYLSHPKYTICSEWAADVNCDHSINESDLLKLRYYVGYPRDPRYTLNCCE